MKKIIPFLVLALALLACNLSTTPPPTAVQQSPTEIVLASPTAALPLILPGFTQDAPLAPTSTLVVPSPAANAGVPTLTPMPLPQTMPYETIQFASGGTAKDTQDSILSGDSKTYMVGAMQGQIMAVSVISLGEGAGYFPLQIQGRDGTVLCPVQQDTECSFWRGTLPLTQNYFIIVKAGGDKTDFVLRVAIDPPGTSEQLFNYKSSAGGFGLLYSDQFTPASFPSSLNNKTTLQFALQFIDTGSYINTNLGEAYLVLGSSAQAAAGCTQPNQSGAPETPTGDVVIGGYTFASSKISDAGAGNIYDQYIYRLLKNNVCYEAIYFIHSSNIGNFPPGVVKEFDLNGLLQKFNGVLATLNLK